MRDPLGVRLNATCMQMCRPLLNDGEDDVAFCKRLTVEAGVTALPVRRCIRLMTIWVPVNLPHVQAKNWVPGTSGTLMHDIYLSLNFSARMHETQQDGLWGQLHQALDKMALSGRFIAQVSAFYASSKPPSYLARFCFCKDDSKLKAASQALRRYFLR